MRQQYTFAPPDTVLETEMYRTDLQDVASMELMIIPDIADATATASLQEWRMGAASQASRAVVPREAGECVTLEAEAAGQEARFSAWREQGAVRDRISERRVMAVFVGLLVTAIAALLQTL